MPQKRQRHHNSHQTAHARFEGSVNGETKSGGRCGCRCTEPVVKSDTGTVLLELAPVLRRVSRRRTSIIAAIGLHWASLLVPSPAASP